MDGGPVNAPRAVRIPGPAWAFLILAIVVAALWVILGPLAFMPPELWALWPIQLANGVATVLVGAALFIRHPDVWSTCRPLGAAVVLLAVGPLVGAATPIVTLTGWPQADPGQDPDRLMLIWILYGVGIVAATVGVLAIALLWMGIRRSRRHVRIRASRRLAVVLWFSTLLLAIGRLSSELRTLDISSSDVVSVVASISFMTSVASLVALTALTVTAISGARAGESPRTAWWLVAASGLIVFIGDWVIPIIGLMVQESVALVIVLPQGVRLGSTLLLLSAFALGLSSTEGGGDQRAAESIDDATPTAALQP